jgi:hypothetical protein
VSEKERAGIAKLFIRTEAHYIFSSKRKPGSSKSDRRLELIGGRLEAGESPRQALIREVQEEELSGTIAAKVKNQQLNCKRVNISRQKHFIFEVWVNEDDIKRLMHNEVESYGFSKVEEEIINEKDELRASLSRFTPKTRRIFRALGLV